MKWIRLMILFVLCASCSDEQEVLEDELFPPYEVDILFSTSGVGDSGYNDIILYGIQQSCKAHGFRLEIHQPGNLEDGWKFYEDWQREEAGNAKKLFIFASSDYEDLVRKQAIIKQPGKELLLFESDGELENVGSFRLSMYGASYYIGKLVGRMVPSAAVLSSNPVDKVVHESEVGFRDGFLNDGAKYFGVSYLAEKANEGYNLPDSAYIRSFSLFQDYSFVFPLAGGSNMGVFRYTREFPGTIFSAGMDADMSAYSNRIICSLVKRLDLVLEEYISAWLQGDPLDGFERYGMESGFVEVIFAPDYQETLSPLAEGLLEEAISKEKAYETNK